MKPAGRLHELWGAEPEAQAYPRLRAFYGYDEAF